MALFRGRLAFMVLVLLAVNFLRWWHGDDEVILAVAAQPGDFDDEFNEHLFHSTWGETLASQAHWESEWGSTQLDADLPAPPEPNALPATSLSSSSVPDPVPHLSDEHGMNVAGQVAEQALPVDDLLDYEDYVDRYIRRMEDLEPRDAHGEDVLASPGDCQATVATPVDWEEQESTVDEEEGWVRRNGEWKRGRDRWHNRDGSLKNPPSRQHTWDPTNPWPCSWDDYPPEGATSSSSSGGDTGIEEGPLPEGRPLPSGELTTIDELAADVPWGDIGIEEGPLPEGRPLPSGEPTTLDELDADAPRPSQTRTMDEADQAGGSTYATGFYRNGEWIPRERTPQELRFHTGGQGSFFVVLVEFWDLAVMFYLHDNWVDLLLCSDNGVDYKLQHLRVDLSVFSRHLISLILLSPATTTTASTLSFLGCSTMGSTTWSLTGLGYILSFIVVPVDFLPYAFVLDYLVLLVLFLKPTFFLVLPLGIYLSHQYLHESSERASLQEAGLREVQMQRLEALMECLDGWYKKQSKDNFRRRLDHLISMNTFALMSLKAVLKALLAWGGLAGLAGRPHPPIVRRNPANSETNEDMSGHDSAHSDSVDLEASSDGELYSMDSSHALDEHGVLVEVPPQTGPGPFGPPPPQPVNHPLAPTELMGIWREPEEEPGPFTSTSTSTTGETLTLSSPSTLWDEEADGLELMQEFLVLELGNQGTSTSTSTSTQVMPADIVRNATNNALALCNRADTLEVLRRLLHRCRHMQHCSRLLLDAVEEALQWVELPESALALNAGIVDRLVWGEVSRQVAHGSSATPDRPSHWVTDPSVVLQPGFPRDVAELRSALPGIPDHVAAGYRRRAWRLHIHELYRALGRESPRGNWPAEEDRDLFLVQQSLEREVDNWMPTLVNPLLEMVGAGMHIVMVLVHLVVFFLLIFLLQQGYFRRKQHILLKNQVRRKVTVVQKGSVLRKLQVLH
ncbi:DEGP10, partial [Symbiodinium sp. CCMP2592]